jgi:hypothetical protein
MFKYTSSILIYYILISQNTGKYMANKNPHNIIKYCTLFIAILFILISLTGVFNANINTGSIINMNNNGPDNNRDIYTGSHSTGLIKPLPETGAHPDPAKLIKIPDNYKKLNLSDYPHNKIYAIDGMLEINSSMAINNTCIKYGPEIKSNVTLKLKSDILKEYFSSGKIINNYKKGQLVLVNSYVTMASINASISQPLKINYKSGGNYFYGNNSISGTVMNSTLSGNYIIFSGSKVLNSYVLKGNSDPRALMIALI